MLAQLSSLITNHFDLEELRSLCLELSVDYDSLRGEGKASKSRELVLLLARNDALESLHKSVSNIRPNVNWPPIPKQFDMSKELYATASPVEVTQFPDVIGGHRIMRPFDQALTKALQKFGRTVKQMTSDQYRIIETLRNHNRVLIQGCAGSGKTLVAAEQSIRFANAGLRTLLLCHNPVLAYYLRELTQESRVEVWSITKWVSTLASVNAPNLVWSHYVEPTSEILERAASRLGPRDISFDAIVVDEGQDFREEWWILIELALADSERGRLHIFGDDNQMLLPSRSSSPVAIPPFVLTRNVRNGGVVFDLMSAFHPAAPEPEVGLMHKGEVMLHSVRRKEKAIRKLKWVVAKRLRLVPASRITILILDSNGVEDFIASIKSVEGPAIPLPEFSAFGRSTDKSIAVHGVDSFKGMESDLVIFFIASRESFTETQLYVAISRARLYLDIITDPDIAVILKQYSTLVSMAGIDFARQK